MRNEEERYGQLCLTDREMAEDLSSHAEKEESDAARLREDLDVMMGTWVNDCVGATRGNFGVHQLRVPLDPQLQSMGEEGRDHPCDLSE